MLHNVSHFSWSSMEVVTIVVVWPWRRGHLDVGQLATLGIWIAIALWNVCQIQVNGCASGWGCHVITFSKSTVKRYDIIGAMSNEYACNRSSLNWFLHDTHKCTWQMCYMHQPCTAVKGFRGCWTCANIPGHMISRLFWQCTKYGHQWFQYSGGDQPSVRLLV